VALLIWALLHLGAPALFQRPGGHSLATFDVQANTAAHSPTTQKAKARAAARATPVVAKTTPAPPLPPAPLPNPKAPPAPPMLAMNLGDSDIGKMEKAPKGDDGDSGKDSAAPYGPGEGPGGAPLYEAEWYKKPGPNVLQLYYHGAAPPGSWATIACRTIDAYHVDNCQQLDENPRGSGLSRALRQAAWQFLVRPPRRGGKALIGSWVRIRFTFTKDPTKPDDAAGPSDGSD
jgi:hypothetical protein